MNVMGRRSESPNSGDENHGNFQADEISSTSPAVPNLEISAKGLWKKEKRIRNANVKQDLKQAESEPDDVLSFSSQDHFTNFLKTHNERVDKKKSSGDTEATATTHGMDEKSSGRGSPSPPHSSPMGVYSSSEGEQAVSEAFASKAASKKSKFTNQSMKQPSPRSIVTSVNHDYTDYSRVPDSELHTVGSSDKLPERRKNTGGVVVPFPEKLHQLLTAASSSNLICWSPHGRCFIILKPKEFASTVMSEYFKHTKLTSFQRQLNLYGFKRITRGKDRGAYYHELFLRGRPKLCARMRRQKIKGTGHKPLPNPDKEPDFYSMPCIDPPEEEVGNRSGVLPSNDHHENSSHSSSVSSPAGLPTELALQHQAAMLHLRRATELNGSPQASFALQMMQHRMLMEQQLRIRRLQAETQAAKIRLQKKQRQEMMRLNSMVSSGSSECQKDPGGLAVAWPDHHSGRKQQQQQQYQQASYSGGSNSSHNTFNNDNHYAMPFQRISVTGATKTDANNDLNPNRLVSAINMTPGHGNAQRRMSLAQNFTVEAGRKQFRAQHSLETASSLSMDEHISPAMNQERVARRLSMLSIKGNASASKSPSTLNASSSVHTTGTNTVGSGRRSSLRSSLSSRRGSAGMSLGRRDSTSVTRSVGRHDSISTGRRDSIMSLMSVDTADFNSYMGAMKSQCGSIAGSLSCVSKRSHQSRRSRRGSIYTGESICSEDWIDDVMLERRHSLGSDMDFDGLFEDASLRGGSASRGSMRRGIVHEHKSKSTKSRPPPEIQVEQIGLLSVASA